MKAVSIKTKEKTYMALIRPTVEFVAAVRSLHLVTLSKPIEMVLRGGGRHGMGRYMLLAVTLETWRKDWP